MSIINPPTGNFTPGAQFSIDTVAAVINAAWGQGNAKQAQFEAKIANAIDGWDKNPPFMGAACAGEIEVDEPTVTIPATADVTDVMAQFDEKWADIISELAAEFTAFRTTYFPDEQAAYTAAEDWLQAALANPEHGVPKAVAAQLLTDDRDRILADAARAQDEVLQTFAARRFPMPPGAAAGAVLQIQQGAQDKIAESSRKLSALSIEQMRFAVDKLISTRQIAMSAAVDYIKALASPDLAAGLVSTGYDAQSKLISAVSSFYNARTNAKQLTAGMRQANAAFAQESGKANLQSELTMYENRLKALLTEAQALAQMATALYNNVGASASTGYSVSGSTGT